MLFRSQKGVYAITFFGNGTIFDGYATSRMFWMITSSYGGPQDAEQRDIRTAVQRAYNELTTINEWSYYYTHGRIITQDTYQTGTVAYNASTRILSLTGGTWPSWAKYGSVAIGRLIARVSKEGATNQELVMDPSVTFPSTLAAGQSYVLFRTDYPLPSDFRNMDEPSNEYNWWSGLYLKPDEAMKWERVGNRSGKPWHWTILKDPDGTGYVLKLVGYPTSKETLDFTYRRYPRPLRWSGHEPAARFASVAGGNAGGVDPVEILATGASFSSTMVGSIFRRGTASAYPGSLESLTPYESEHLIEAVGQLTVPNDLLQVTDAVDFATCRGLVTDPADVGRHMQTALHSCCEYWLTRIRGGKADQAFAAYQRDLRLAMEQDQLAPLAGRTQTVWNDGGWRSALRADQG